MKYIDLFGGIGGFSYGIKQATEKNKGNGWNTKKHCKDGKYKPIINRGDGNGRGSYSNNRKWECVWYCDNDKYAVQTYNKNYGTNYKATDITTIGATDIPDHDLICGGFPCQTFSLAGSRKGFSDIRGTMFFEIMRIAKAKRTKYLFLENVKGLLNHNKGKTFTTILQTMEKLGYEVEWMVLNSKFFGVPQNRERVFIIGSLSGEPRPEILPFREDAKEIPGVSQDKLSVFTQERKEFRTHKTEGTPTLKNRMGTGGNNVPMVHSLFPRLTKELRRLTPIECERLQGFPDNWTEGVSDTQRYKQCGNAVTTNVIKSIVRRWNEKDNTL